MIMEAFNLTHILTIVVMPVVIYLWLNYALKKKDESVGSA